METKYGKDLAKGEEGRENSVGGSWLVTRCHESKTKSELKQVKGLLDGTFYFFIPFSLVEYELVHSFDRIWTQRLHQLNLLILEAYIMTPQSVS